MTRTPCRASIPAACALMAMSSAPVPTPTNARARNSAGTERVRPGNAVAAAKVPRASGTSRAPNRSASRPAASIAGSAASATHSNATPSCASLAPVERWIAGRHAAQAPQ